MPGSRCYLSVDCYLPVDYLGGQSVARQRALDTMPPAYLWHGLCDE